MSCIICQMLAYDPGMVKGFGKVALLKTPYLSSKYKWIILQDQSVLD